MGKTFKVHIREVKDYYLEVEADSELEAGDVVYSHPDFVNGISQELDSEVVEVKEIK